MNPVTNNNFDGIFSIDTLKEIKEKPTLIVCNTDPSDKAGEHWVLFFFHDNTVDFYDSLAHEITYFNDLNSFILLKGLLIILSILSDEPNLLKLIYVDIIVCIMLLKNVKVILWKILLIIFLLKMIL